MVKKSNVPLLKEKFYRALLQAMQEKDINQITTNDLCRLSRLPHSKFRYFFKDTKALTTSLLNEIVTYYFTGLKTKGLITNRIALNSHINYFLDFWWNHQKLVSVLIQQNINNRLNTVWINASVEYYKNCPFFKQISNPKLILLFVMNGLTALLNDWLSSSDPLPPNKEKSVLFVAIIQILKTTKLI